MKKESKDSSDDTPSVEKNDFNKGSTAYKNKIFRYKDGTTTRVVYDSKDPNYIEIRMDH